MRRHFSASAYPTWPGVHDLMLSINDGALDPARDTAHDNDLMTERHAPSAQSSIDTALRAAPGPYSVGSRYLSSHLTVDPNPPGACDSLFATCAAFLPEPPRRVELRGCEDDPQFLRFRPTKCGGNMWVAFR